MTDKFSGGNALTQYENIPVEKPANPRLYAIRVIVLGAWPAWADPQFGHLFDRPPGASLSPRQIEALRMVRMSNPGACVPQRSVHKLKLSLTVERPRRVLARVALRLLRLELNARDLLRQLDAANARLSAPLPIATVRGVAIWAANTRRSARHAA